MIDTEIPTCYGVHFSQYTKCRSCSEYDSCGPAWAARLNRPKRHATHVRPAPGDDAGRTNFRRSQVTALSLRLSRYR